MAKRRGVKPNGTGKARKGNPAGGAAAAFEDFQGRPSKEVVTVTQKVHYHEHLAAAGKLIVLEVVARTGNGLSGQVEVANWVKGDSAHDVVRMLKSWGVAA